MGGIVAHCLGAQEKGGPLGPAFLVSSVKDCKPGPQPKGSSLNDSQPIRACEPQHANYSE
jgi:hypothetical protein